MEMLFPARFNGLMDRRLKPQNGKDVKTPFTASTRSVPAVNDGAMIRGDAERLLKQLPEINVNTP